MGLLAGVKSNSAGVRFIPAAAKLSDENALEIGRINWKKAEDMVFLFLCCF